jgi:hypothetical protein
MTLFPCPPCYMRSAGEMSTVVMKHYGVRYTCTFEVQWDAATQHAPLLTCHHVRPSRLGRCAAALSFNSFLPYTRRLRPWNCE